MHSRLDVEDFIDRIPFSGLQRSILWLCFLVVAIDGFDTAAAGFIAPAIREDRHLARRCWRRCSAPAASALVAPSFLRLMRQRPIDRR